MRRELIILVTILVVIMIPIAYILSLIFPVLGGFCCTSMVYLVVLLAIFLVIWAFIAED